MMHAAGAKRASTDKAMTRRRDEEGSTDTNLFPRKMPRCFGLREHIDCDLLAKMLALIKKLTPNSLREILRERIFSPTKILLDCYFTFAIFFAGKLKPTKI